ncbi:hypothetical protein [Sulfurospirillum sp. 1612]|uniref:hypothetical protein n=1 Tax=Sulfurospirillum sp. 1612 TaxID=3094835 RepID=UPI002F92963F
MRKVIIVAFLIMFGGSALSANTSRIDARINSAIAKFDKRIKSGGYGNDISGFVADAINCTAALIAKNPNDLIPATADKVSKGLASSGKLMDDLIDFAGARKGSIIGLLQSGQVPSQVNLKSVDLSTKGNSLTVSYDTTALWVRFIQFPRYFTGKSKSFMIKRRLLMISFLLSEGYYSTDFSNGVMKHEFVTTVKLALRGNAKAIKILTLLSNYPKLESYLESIRPVNLATKMIFKKFEYFGYHIRGMEQ